MAECLYDNPKSRRRELYRDGVLLASVSDMLLYATQPNEQRAILANFARYAFNFTLSDWKSGQIIGDSAALPKQGTKP